MLLLADLLDGFGFVGVVGDLSIVAGWRIASCSGLPAMVRKRTSEHLMQPIPGTVNYNWISEVID